MYLADFYLEGKYVKRDIKMAIKLYKEASIVKETYAKNNIGVIWKNGYVNVVEKNYLNAKIYFNDSIRESNNPLSLYNMANIILDEEETNKKIEESIDLLLKSSLRFRESNILICVILIKQYSNKKIYFEY